jgi:hypothetical protein
MGSLYELVDRQCVRSTMDRRWRSSPTHGAQPPRSVRAHARLCREIDWTEGFFTVAEGSWRDGGVDRSVKKLAAIALSSLGRGFNHEQEDLGAGMDVVECDDDPCAFYSGEEAVERR